MDPQLVFSEIKDSMQRLMNSFSELRNNIIFNMKEQKYMFQWEIDSFDMIQSVQNTEQLLIWFALELESADDDYSRWELIEILYKSLIDTQSEIMEEGGRQNLLDIQ